MECDKMGFFRALGAVVAVATIGPLALAAIVPGGPLNNMCGIDGYCDDGESNLPKLNQV